MEIGRDYFVLGENKEKILIGTLSSLEGNCVKFIKKEQSNDGENYILESKLTIQNVDSDIVEFSGAVSGIYSWEYGTIFGNNYPAMLQKLMNLKNGVEN